MHAPNRKGSREQHDDAEDDGLSVCKIEHARQSKTGHCVFQTGRLGVETGRNARERNASMATMRLNEPRLLDELGIVCEDDAL
jgi:hypothetical protein